MQGTNAFPADGIACNIQVRPEVQGFRTIQDIEQCLTMNISKRRVEKARANVTRCFDHGRNPGCVAPGRHILGLAKMGTEMLGDAA